ncbi:DUF3800 domain-containing protein [Aestuariivirga litoralis]|uniref:DUF3800 domain-containing protein n=1 Tax=Aestuariivirga litoralis TaxID=2650924 RepID=UPI0018C6CCD5|nr:DUF3800 domain-containing protein [Aestuariivirga litoralis]MBG1231096.1 DUF3800 domain-containing protein [Aestuariivirga litoralis]
MGESKKPFFAYVDETGNTGHNIFDPAQPDFFSGALITKGDFDLNFGKQISAISQQLNTEALHARVLGIGKIETVASQLLRILESAEATFFLSRVEKKYLLASKMFDVLFDSGENPAVPWQFYNLRGLRLIGVFKLSALIEEQTAKKFWASILEPDTKKAHGILFEVCEELLANIGNLPDEGSRKVLSEGLSWAKSHPEAIQVYTEHDLSKHGHFPNLVAFSNLLRGLQSLSEERKKPVHTIKHDQQSEFEKTLQMWHGLFSNASGDEIKWAGETYKMQSVPGSEFKVLEDTASAGIQIVDVVLWLYSQTRKAKKLPKDCALLVKYALNNGWHNDFSFEGVETAYMEKFGSIISTPLTEEKMESTKKMLEMAEKSRLESIAQYEIDKIPPFLRDVTRLRSQ